MLFLSLFIFVIIMVVVVRSVCNGREDEDNGIGGCKGEDDENDDHGKNDIDKSEGD